MSYLTRHPAGHLFAALCLVLLILLPESARAAIFTVTATADHGVGSLRAAIDAANAAAGDDIINFAPGIGGVIAVTSVMQNSDSYQHTGAGRECAHGAAQHGRRHARL